MAEHDRDQADQDELDLDIGRVKISEEPQPLSKRPNEMSKPTTSGITARDITAEFFKASSELKIGELVKDEWFTLFESVAALEIMDPKMDSGYLAPGETFQDSYDISRKLSSAEVVGIMDQLLCHEMAWHMGSPLSQSLFTSVYIDKLLWPEPRVLTDAQFFPGGDDDAPLLQRILRAYCLGLVKCCDFVHKQISSEHCYEEEDFVTHLYNRNLLSEIPKDEVLNLLDRALSCVESPTDPASEAVKERLIFRRSLLLALANDHSCVEDSSATFWDECAESLPRIRQSFDTGTPVNESFSIKIQRKLASTVPPRPIVDLKFEDAMAHLERLCRDGMDIVRVIDYQGSNNLLTFVWAFQSRKPQPSVYIRTLLQSLLFDDMKILSRLSIKQLLFDDLAEVSLPDDMTLDPRNWEIEVPTDPRFQIAQKMDKFVLRAGQSYLDVFRAICQNRSRIRRTLCHTIQDWDELQLDAEELDVALQPLTQERPIHDPSLSHEPLFSFPISSWAYHHKLLQMQWIIQLGFELDIYQPDELGGIYWDLQRLASHHLAHLERTRSFVLRNYSRLHESSPPTKPTAEAYTKTLSFLHLAMLHASATQAFADGLHCFYTSLTRLSLLPTPVRPYSTDTLRYELRQKPFLHITLPAPVAYEEFRAQIQVEKLSARELLEHASAVLLAARKTLEVMAKLSREEARCVLCEEEWRASIRGWMKAAVVGRIAVGRVIAALDAEGGVRAGTLKVDVGVGGDKEGLHAWWVVPSVTAEAV